MISFANKYGRNIHSQNGEDGIIAESVKRVGLAHGHCVEIGGNDGLWMSNTRAVIESGWSGLFVESDWTLYQRCVTNWKDNPLVRVQCCHVNGENINAFVDERCDLLSTDTDGSDYEIFKGLTAKPKIIIVEIDSSIPPDVDGFNSDGGAGYRPMVELGMEKGYRLLCHTGNLVFIDKQYKDLFPEIKGYHPIIESSLYFNQGWLKQEEA
jgi:hypothetical protein